jgi:Glycosyl hydrolase catalytic core
MRFILPFLCFVYYLPSIGGEPITKAWFGLHFNYQPTRRQPIMGTSGVRANVVLQLRRPAIRSARYFLPRHLRVRPMMWGISDQENDPSFLGNITVLVNKERRITHVLTMNDRDVTWDLGGSNIEPAKATQRRESNIVPLKDENQGVLAFSTDFTRSQRGRSLLGEFPHASVAKL